ncbi:MAG TPA: hypothetical protein DCY00_07800 [Actinobacteria bacterium]|nr:hypothetical protein [Actinomycetota bacterium]
MNINSEYIQKKEFHTVFKGYSMEEVDKFLDIIAVEFDRLTKKNKELQDNLDKMKFENPSQNEDVSKLVSDVLVSAHKVADEIKRKAEIEARELVEHKKGTEVLEINSLIEKKKKIDSQLEQSQNVYKDFLEDIKSSIKELSSKIENIEKNFSERTVISQDSEEINTRSGESESETDEIQKEDITNSEVNDFHAKNENNITQSEVGDKVIEFEEDKKIRDFIESGDMAVGYKDTHDDSYDKSDSVKTDKKIFDEFEEEKIYKDKRKTDIGNPDIIDEFFGDNEERNY